MFAATTLTALTLAVAAAAQTVHQIAVGGPASAPFVFSPPNITAAQGDIVMFTWSGAPGNHSVTQSSFTDPCNPLAAGGFDTGTYFIPQGTAAGFPLWNITITNASQPIWFFCKQLIPQPHCSDGMVGAINAPQNGSNTFDAYLANAKAFSGNSGQGVGFLVGPGASASTVPGPVTGSGIVAAGVPTATSPPAGGASTSGSSSSSSGSTSPTTSPNAALGTKANGLIVFAAAMFGVILA